ncbi:MAG: hypothetical protein RBG13Loki_1783 [Promethearchaeota archaeon CR_4]|nr:MAG: hypothetical protein RBG13Loki_1783 [Candidatus Lokiarchaeota archaeon CR_4]
MKLRENSRLNEGCCITYFVKMAREGEYPKVRDLLDIGYKGNNETYRQIILSFPESKC